MSKTGWLIIWSLTVIAIFAIDRWAATASAERSKERGYPAPSHVVLQTNLTDDQLMQLARDQVRATSTQYGRLGVIPPGRKGLILISDDQDMRVMSLIVRALRERGADADYLRTTDLLEKYGYPRELAAPVLEHIDPKIQPMLVELKTYFAGGSGLKGAAMGLSFFSESVRKELPEDDEKLIVKAQKAFDAKIFCVKSYLDSHPEYEYVFIEGSIGGPEFSRWNFVLGGKYQIGWQIKSVQALAQQATLPPQVQNAIEDKVMDVVPWIEHVHVTDPEGTDLEWSVTPEEAKIWRMGAYLPDYLRMYPLQACRFLYQMYGITRVVAPESKGVFAGTSGHGHYFPRIVMKAEHGMVESIEGGSIRGDLMRDLLHKYKDLQIPYMPRPGWYYVFQIMLNSNVMNGAGEITWGFGPELYFPGIPEFGEKHGMPVAHDTHLGQHFPTYEATVTGGKKIKVLDKGNLLAVENPEVRMVASKYGDPDVMLRPLNRPAIPGINVPGSYDDYAKDPWRYVEKQYKQIKDGTYPYSVKMSPDQLRGKRKH